MVGLRPAAYSSADGVYYQGFCPLRYKTQPIAGKMVNDFGIVILHGDGVPFGDRVCCRAKSSLVRRLNSSVLSPGARVFYDASGAFSPYRRRI